MRVISRRRPREYWELNPSAQRPLEAWFKVTEKARWADFSDIRATFANASGVPLDCGITAIVFNIGGNKFRLITRVEYKFHAVYVKQILTHRQYDSDQWKDDLCGE